MSETLDTSEEVAAEEFEAEVTTESIVEALLLSTDVPLSAGKIAQLLGGVDAADIKRVVEELNDRYEQAQDVF